MSIRWRLASVCFALVVASAATTALFTRAAAQRDLVWVAIAAALILGLPAVLSAVWFGRDLDDAVSEVVADAEAIAGGDLAVEPRPLPGPLGRLPDALGRMTRSVALVLGGIRRVAGQLGSAGVDASAALERQSSARRGLDETLVDVGGVAGRLATAGVQLRQTTGGLVDAARAAARVADDGRGGLARMTVSMGQLEEALDAFVRKLATISQRASGITAVVTTIAKVAEQTNLLSVNATIEAEKAGESGRGFRIVAQEIRRLADQTALATKDIERMVRDMQAAVTGGTMEMDRFRAEVSGRMAEVTEVSEKLARIVEPVQAVTRSLEQVHDGMEAQAVDSRRILDSVQGLQARADDLAAAAAACSAAIDAVRAAAAELDGETAGLVLPEPEGSAGPA